MPDAIVYCDQCMRMILPSDIKAGDALVTKHGGICLECLNSLSPAEKEALTLQTTDIKFEAPKPVSSARNVVAPSTRRPGSSAHHRAIKNIKPPLSGTMGRVAASGSGPAVKPPTGQHRLKRTGMHVPVRKREGSNNTVVLLAAIGAGALVSGIVLLLAVSGGEGETGGQPPQVVEPPRVNEHPKPPDPIVPENTVTVAPAPRDPSHTISRFPGASHAYAFRKLSSTYSGPCVRVRRGADDREDDIAFSGDSLDTGYLLGFVGQGDGFVVRWYDQAGNRRDLSQRDRAKQPIIVRRGILIQDDDGNPAIAFSGGGLTLSASSPPFAFGKNACSVFVVHSLPDAYERAFPLLGKGGSGWTVEETSHRFRTGSEGWRSTERADTAGRQVTALVRNATLVMHVYDNGTSQGTIVGTAGDPDLDSVGEGDYLQHGGLIYEVIYYNSDQSSQRADIEAAVRQEYATAKAVAKGPDPATDDARREERRKIDERAERDRRKIEELARDAKFDEAIALAQESLKRLAGDVVQTTTFTRLVTELREQKAAADAKRKAEQKTASREAQLAAAATAIDEGRFSDAEAALQAAGLLGADVSDLLADVRFRALVAQADASVRNGSDDKAIALYQKALGIRDEPNVRARFVEFERDRRLAKWRDEIVQSINAQDAKAARATLRLYLKDAEGDMAAKGHELRERLEVLEKADALVAEAREASRRGRWPAALRTAEDALQKFPEHKAADAVSIKAREMIAAPPHRVSNALGMELVLVPAGTVCMGSDDTQADERPSHNVEIDAFYMGLYEVTNAQYERFDDEHRARRGKTSPQDADPVANVSWEDATAFCKWLSNKENVRFRLPTEAEWERAARGSDRRAYPWGGEAPIVGRTARANLYAGARNAWSRDNALYATAVGSYTNGASPFGILDLAGNVAEWCADWYGREYFAHSPAANPAGPERGKVRVVRGGSYDSREGDLRSSSRAFLAPRKRLPTVGFRVVREVFPK